MKEREPTIPVGQGVLFFASLPLLTKIMGNQAAIGQNYEAQRANHTGWPSWKSMKSWFFSDVSSFPHRPGTISKIKGMAEDKQVGVESHAIAVRENLIWPAHSLWYSFFKTGSGFSSAFCDYWMPILDEELTLISRIIHTGETDKYAQQRLVGKSDLARKLRHPLASVAMERFLNDPESPSSRPQDYTDARTLDVFCVLAKISAWTVADRLSDLGCGHGRELVVRAQTLVPSMTSRGAWSVPMSCMLDNISMLAGAENQLNSIRNIAHLWADHERSDVESKRRLLDYWSQEFPVRPTKPSLFGLASALEGRTRHASVDAALIKDAVRLCLAWQNARLWLTKEGASDHIIKIVGDVMRSEMRNAFEFLLEKKS